MTTKKSHPSVAVQYREISRRPGKCADIVERNSSQMAAVLGYIPVREATIPNGTKEGIPVIMARVDGGKIVLNLGDWLVVEDGKFKVYTNEVFRTTFNPV
jgi:fructose-specific phosphotransferase system IIC component